uniref:Nephrocystin 3-like N-terminal domain-containing protein n=1 Tax=Mycena chlorophos TaxID=658473 RepID=A0ABQ0LSY7_MYCCL|nr:predicted protein [Mycena chlorophos]
MLNPRIVNITAEGGRGGTGGAGGHSGGSGGIGQGAQVNFERVDSVHVHHNDQAITSKRQENTGAWLLEHPTFKEWEAGSEKILWCHGIPGAGKTVLASKAVDYFKSLTAASSTIGVAFVYLNYQEAGQQTLQNLLAALWRQLSIGQDIQAATKLYKTHEKDETTPALDDIKDLLKARVQVFTKVHIVMDALDEYLGSTDQLLDAIQNMGPQIALLVTCRPHIWPPTGKATPLEIVASAEDMKIYVSSQIQGSTNLKVLVQQEASLHQVIISTVIDKAGGMYVKLDFSDFF